MKIRYLLVVLLALATFSCNRGGDSDFVAGPFVPSVTSPIKVRIVDVSNDTHKVHDVDVIGLLWNGMEDSLKRRGMLWRSQMGGKPYLIEARVVYFKKGNMAGRLLPYVGDTVLSVKCELKDGDQRSLATIETKHKFSFGSNTMTRAAWRKLFDEVSEEVITEAVRKL
ncbi:MAG: hypothetical protein LLG06_10435 [Desulfobacteraceae bacterium]|nr:hypothetical protein [Desulfobacteraceae bacterium]